jgi:periplasmic protein TonB
VITKLRKGMRVGWALTASLMVGCASGTPAYVPELVDPIELSSTDVVTPPEPVERRAPIYPQRLRDAGIEGVVVVRAIVNRDGALETMEVVRSDHHELTRSVLEALRGWRFRPATVNGEPVAVYYTLTQSFTLSRF